MLLDLNRRSVERGQLFDAVARLPKEPRVLQGDRQLIPHRLQYIEITRVKRVDACFLDDQHSQDPSADLDRNIHFATSIAQTWDVAQFAGHVPKVLQFASDDGLVA